MSQKRASQLDINLKVLDSSAEENPLEDESFDSVVCTYTLCTIPDPDKALLEVKRVLKNGGYTIFIKVLSIITVYFYRNFSFTIDLF